MREKNRKESKVKGWRRDMTLWERVRGSERTYWGIRWNLTMVGNSSAKHRHCS